MKIEIPVFFKENLFVISGFQYWLSAFGYAYLILFEYSKTRTRTLSTKQLTAFQMIYSASIKDEINGKKKF